MNSQVKEFLLHKERRACADHGYKVDDKYLGGGATGRVFLARPTKKKIKSSEKLILVKKKNEQLKVAIKICYADIGAECISALWKCLPGEIANCNKCFGLPNIVNLLDVFLASKRIFMVLEFAARGDLRQTFIEHIHRNPPGKRYLNEELAAYYFAGVAKGVQQLHAKNIAHRDLKLENVLVTEDEQVKICDLGFSVAASKQLKVPHDLLATTNCGTRGYVAPEVSKRHETPYNPFKADVWSMGVILFLLTHGYLPFDGKTSDEISQKISDSKGQSLRFRKGLSLGCKELLNRLLERNSKDRPRVDEIVQDQWLQEHTLLNESPPKNTNDLTVISGNSVYKFQSTYVSHYLWQRMMLLEERRSFLLDAGNSPEDLRDAGIMIALPRKDTGGVRVTEVWRLEENELRKTGDIPNPYKRKHDRKSKVLQDPWAWSPDVEEPTLGIRCVERVLTESPLLGEWREFLEKGKSPELYSEYRMIHSNTVDLAEKSWRPIHGITKPCPKRDKAYERTAKFAAVRQNLLGFYYHEKRSSGEEVVLSTVGSGEGKAKKQAISCDAFSTTSCTKNAKTIVNNQEHEVHLKEQIDIHVNTKKSEKSVISQTCQTLHSPKVGDGRLKKRTGSEKSLHSTTSHDSKEKFNISEGLKSKEKLLSKKRGQREMQTVPSISDTTPVKPDTRCKDKSENKDTSYHIKKSNARNELAKYTKAGKQSRVDVQVCEAGTRENPLSKFSTEKAKEQPIMKPVNPYIYRAVLELLSESDSDHSNVTKCRPKSSQHARRNDKARTDAPRKHLKPVQSQKHEHAAKVEDLFHGKNLKVENNVKQMDQSRAKLIKKLKRSDLQKLQNVAKIPNAPNIVERPDPLKTPRAHPKLKEDLLKARKRSQTLAEQPPPVIRQNCSRSNNPTKIAAIADELNLVVPNTETKQLNINKSMIIGDGANQPQESGKPLIQIPKQNVIQHLKSDKVSEIFPEHCPMMPRPPKTDRRSARPHPSMFRHRLVASMFKNEHNVDNKCPRIVKQGQNLVRPKTPTQPNQNRNMSAARQRGILSRSPQKCSSENEMPMAKDVISATEIDFKIYEPRPPKQDKSTSARIKRRNIMPQSVHICDKEDKSLTASNNSRKQSASNGEECRAIQIYPRSYDESRGGQQHVNGANMRTNDVKARSVSNPPEATETQTKGEQPHPDNYKGMTKAFQVVSRQFGRILRRRSPYEGEPRDVGIAEPRPVRTQGTKPDELRQARVTELCGTKQTGWEEKARVDVVKGKPPIVLKHRRSAILQRRFRFLKK